MALRTKTDEILEQIRIELSNGLDPDILLSTPELAKILRCTPCHLQQMRSRGEGPKYIAMSPKMIRYRWDDVLTWLGRFRVEPSDAHAHQDKIGV